MNPDDVVLDFTPGTLVILNVVLGLIMFGIALDTIRAHADPPRHAVDGARHDPVFRIGTILGPTVRNQITALWDGRAILGVRGSDSPFVFVWVDDVAAAMARAATDGPPGTYNVAGDGRVTVHEIGRRLGKPVIAVPARLLAFGLRIGRMLRLTVHGPEQIGFLRHRPVLANDALTRDFGFTPAKTSAVAFEVYLATHPGVARR
ncbi:hypothetical protein [Microbacterium sp. CPCC 204701]|uniref:hypothetical protein n=1 Tax=Microbacterium sp. CPCC 204701 TaxID=2493084 RepID=UPI001F0C30B8|nr:hypothetical protein [Microbacterium sp. CPCC 204701]